MSNRLLLEEEVGSKAADVCMKAADVRPKAADVCMKAANVS